jgi:hypothetical protein
MALIEDRLKRLGKAGSEKSDDELEDILLTENEKREYQMELAKMGLYADKQYISRYQKKIGIKFRGVPHKH